jgi:hypothetical protein
MTTHSAPEDGDIVVREEQRERRVVYLLHTAPGADQYLLHSRQEAVAQATTVAKRQHVRVWLTDEHNVCTLLKDFRVAKSA